jgi:hypothetical protein
VIGDCVELATLAVKLTVPPSSNARSQESTYVHVVELLTLAWAYDVTVMVELGQTGA